MAATFTKFARSSSRRYNDRKSYSETNHKQVPLSLQALNNGEDLVEQALKLNPFIGRDEEIHRVMMILSRSTKNNMVLIGERGVGKTAIVKGLAQRIVRGNVPRKLANVRLIALNMFALVAKTKYREEFEEWLITLLKEVQEVEGKVILFINEIHLVLGARKAKGYMDVANFLKLLILLRGQLRCIGTSTLEEYRKYAEKDAYFERRFEEVYLVELSVDDSVSILRGLKERFEGHHGVRILDHALVVAAQLSSRYITGRHLPDKAIDLVDEVCSKMRILLDRQTKEIDNLEKKKMQLEVAVVQKELDDLRDKLEMKYRNKKERIEETVGPEHIAEVVSSWTGLPVTRLGQNYKEWLIGLADRLHQRVVGQDQAINSVAEAMLRRVGHVKLQQPTCSFLFIGPTGVGKTELAKAQLVRVDMTEYMEQHFVSRLIGASPLRYVGQTEVVSEVVSVVLFDEVEKAHIYVFNTLLQVLDDGRLTDGQGRTVDFRNTVIIMTSNLGQSTSLLDFQENFQCKKLVIK
ncbi:hypothetical protein V8G54_008897 [Vigna mungo]|uniref:AAA+ ATPase domain-containing protein n=1 Tax=Vigna mungo TaxID=3915 RepID=A0AAQ3P4W5_VIGMU